MFCLQKDALLSLLILLFALVMQKTFAIIAMKKLVQIMPLTNVNIMMMPDVLALQTITVRTIMQVIALQLTGVQLITTECHCIA